METVVIQVLEPGVSYVTFGTSITRIVRWGDPELPRLERIYCEQLWRRATEEAAHAGGGRRVAR
jgi:hypothetical protein